MTGFAPILDAKRHRIGVVGVDVNADIYVARLAAARRWALLGILPSMLLLLCSLPSTIANVCAALPPPLVSSTPHRSRRS